MSQYLYDRAVVLAKIESTFGVDPSPSASTDAILVEDPAVSYDITFLERNNVSPTLSPEQSATGRRVASVSFMHEVRNNGNTDGTISPVIGRLLRACGMAEVQSTGANGTIGATQTEGKSSGTSTGTFTYTRTTAYSGTLPRIVNLLCTTAGGSGAVRFTVSAPAIGDLPAINSTSVAMTSATPFTLGGGATITPTIGTSFALGDSYNIALIPAGYAYHPASSGFESVTLYVHYEGLLHKVTGARGTFSVEAQGGQYAKFNFEFTGNYEAVSDGTFPTAPVYESTRPQMVELAGLHLKDNPMSSTFISSLTASQFQIDLGNEISIRESINGAAAYAGVMITDRTPTLSFDPESVTVATHDFFGRMASGTPTSFFARIGTTKGNVVVFEAPAVQYSGIGYGNRNNIRTFEVEANLAKNTAAGNDELKITFA